MPAARQRPAGLIFAAVVLGLFAVYGLLNAVLLAIAAFYIRVPQQPSSPSSPTSLIMAFQFTLAFITLALSVFSGFTVLGLFRLKRWARFSIIMFGGLLAACSALFGLLFLFLAVRPLAIPETGGTPALSPSGLRTVFLILFAFSCIGVLIGGWWLVYFNIRSTKALFTKIPLPDLGQPEAIGSSLRVSPRLGLIEILVMCLAALYLLGALSGLITLFARMPLYLAGFVIRGTPAAVTTVALIVLEAAIGVGLFRRLWLAWVAALTFDVYGLLSCLLLFLPASRVSFLNYQMELMRHLAFAPAGAPSPQLGSSLYVFSVVIGVVATTALASLLIRARPLFQSLPQAE